jgi:hypothetical protein
MNWMSTARDLRVAARKLQEKAERASNPMLRDDLLTVAQGYSELADQRERQRADTVR